MAPDGTRWISRRDVLRLMGIGGTMIAAGLPNQVVAQTRKDVLVIGIDISDTISLDPARNAQYTVPMTLEAAYDTLVTMTPGDYITVKPNLATSWSRTPDGKGWRFALRQGVKFASGAPMTAEDVKWSFDRVINLKDQPAQYVQIIDHVAIVDDHTIDIVLNKSAEPLLTVIAAPEFVVLDRKLVSEHGGLDGPGANTEDKATAWLNQNSAGTGAYTITRWVRETQIQFVRNPHSWRGMPPFERVIIRHIKDSGAQLLAIEHGDIDIAFNLIPEQVATLKGNANIRVESLNSLDFVYMGITQEPSFNKALAIKEARQAIAYAIDYAGIRNALLGGAATAHPPASFLPIGVSGSTMEVAEKIGFRDDPAHARELLAKAGLPDGFEFELAYADAAVAGTTYGVLAQKIQADVARVGIRAKITPMDPTNLREIYAASKTLKGAIITVWPPPAVENELWAAATVERVAARVHWTPPDDLVRLVHEAASETDPQKQAQLWIEYQRRMVDQANLVVLFQPNYQIAVRKTLAPLPLTGAGWLLDLHDVKPA